ASTHRLYSIHEKIAIGDALYPTERLLDAARAFSRELHAFDALALSREHGTEVNAILIGALAGSGAMPMRHDAYRDAIRGKGVQGRTPGAVIDVVDYLKPDLDEIYGILPYALAAPFARWAERRWPHGRPTIAHHVRTTTVLGFLRVWLLGRLRRLRPLSYRAHQERARMTQWLA